MADKETIITPNDLDKALLLLPILAQWGISATRRWIEKGGLTSEQLVEKSRELQTDTERRAMERLNRG